MRFPRRPAAVVAVSLSLICTSVLAQAEEGQEDGRIAQGLSSPTAYQFDDLDFVNIFNGSLKLTVPLGIEYPLREGFGYRFVLTYNSNSWKFTQLPNGEQDPRIETTVDPRTNAGLGWRLSFGELLAPGDARNDLPALWVLWEGDGSRRIFRPVDGQTQLQYSGDGSYLRLDTATRRVGGPDGTYREFDAAGRLLELGDLFGNKLNVTYDADGWTVVDSHGRTHRVDVVDGDTGNGSHRIESVTLAAFEGTEAVFDLRYRQQSIRLPKKNYGSVYQTFSTLCAIVLPKASETTNGCVSQSAFSMTYRELGGEVSKLTLPTLGGYEYDWTEFKVAEGTVREDPLVRVNALAAKRAIRRDGTTLGEWLYLGGRPRPDDIAAEWGNLPADGEYLRFVRDPQGNDTVHFFFHPTNGAPGYPFGAKLKDSEGLRLSRREYDGDATVASPSALRSSWVEYDRSPSGPLRGNPRISVEKTVFHDDGDRWRSTTYSDYDGLGHYRRAETEGNFPGENHRVTFTNYNPGRGSQVCQWNPPSPPSCTGNYTHPAPGEPWLLELWDVSQAYEGPIALPGAGNWQREEHRCWDDQGYLTRVRRPSIPGSASKKDRLTVRTRANNGHTIREDFYGGDFDPSSPQQGGCDSPPSGSAGYSIRHTWASGALESTRYVGAPHYETDYVIDQSTGLVRGSSDVSGIETTYSYDELGRISAAIPGNGNDAMTEFEYRDASASVPASVKTSRISENGASVAQSEVIFDGLGRLWKERVLLPDGGWSTRATTYNAMGWKLGITEWGRNTPSTHQTSFQEFDAYGRPKQVVPPDGWAHRITTTRSGVRLSERKVRIATSQTSEVAVETTEEYDRFGRLHSVSEPAGPGGALVTTTYSYDVNDRLTAVKMKPVGGAAQERAFVYDNRGFLLEETHPESGITKYCVQDARGHARRVHDGESRSCSSNLVYPFDREYEYDSFERLISISERVKPAIQVQLRPLKEFTYGSQNKVGDKRLGKLWTAKRTNQLDLSSGPQTVSVLETYVYGERQGRVSQRDTTLSGPFGQYDFSQSFVWNELGDIEDLTYPRRDGCATAPPRTVPYRYTNGFLTSLPGWAWEITYHANQSLRSIRHGNEAIYWQGKDPNDQRRPSYIALQRDPSAPGYGTEPGNGSAFAYDGAGNVTRFDQNIYVYDQANRISWMRLKSNERQDYSYDAYGNLTNFGRSGTRSYSRVVPVSTSTNRLANATYDAAGNVVTTPSGHTHTWSPINTLTSRDEKSYFVYTADDERVGIYDAADREWTWRLRDLDGKLLREWRGGTGAPGIFADGFETGDLSRWQPSSRAACYELDWVRDYVHRQGTQLATFHFSTGVIHHHPDHLGSPFRSTNANREVDSTSFFAYGEELDDDDGFGAQTVLRFTGHERDRNQEGPPDESDDDLDYMHARYHSPVWGRFMSVDPARSGRLGSPQSWNRYAYARNNPVLFVDPNGEDASSWLSAQYTAAGGALERAGAAVKSFGDSLNGGGALGIAADTVLGATGDVVAGFGDLLYVGAATGDAIGAGGHPLDITKAVAADVGRASGIALTLAAPVARVGVAKPAAHPTFQPGPYAGKSMPARSSSQTFTSAERTAMNGVGRCHTCGTRNPGTKSGNFVPDHQPVSALNTGGRSQRLYPQCIHCSREQGLAVARELRKP